MATPSTALLERQPWAVCYCSLCPPHQTANPCANPFANACLFLMKDSRSLLTPPSWEVMPEHSQVAESLVRSTDLRELQGEVCHLLRPHPADRTQTPEAPTPDKADRSSCRGTGGRCLPGITTAPHVGLQSLKLFQPAARGFPPDIVCQVTP